MTFNIDTWKQDAAARKVLFYGPPRRSVVVRALSKPRAHDLVFKALPDARPTISADGHVPCPLPGPAVARAILVHVAEEYDLNPHDIIGPRRLRPLIKARWELYVRLRGELNWSLQRIGRYCGRDHTTVLYGLRKRDASWAKGA